MRIWVLFLSIALLTVHLEASYHNFDDNPNITRREKEALEDCLIPKKHPIKPILDALFAGPRVTTTVDTLKAAGFNILKNQPRSFILVVKHPSLPGYLIKLYLDSDPRMKRNKPGWHWFSNRVHAIRQIEKCINDNHITLYKTPQKWVYPLPYDGNPASKNFILVAEEMKILNDNDNLEAWLTLITKKHLDELAYILKKCGGNSIRPRNLPFCTDGKIAFIDTEYPGKHPRYSFLTPYLSPKMQDYWNKITP